MLSADTLNRVLHKLLFKYFTCVLTVSPEPLNIPQVTTDDLKQMKVQRNIFFFSVSVCFFGLFRFM